MAFTRSAVRSRLAPPNFWTASRRELRRRELELPPVRVSSVATGGSLTGWIVIVQESYEGAIGHTLDTLKRSLLTSSLIACALIGVLLAVLWALAIRTWGEAARPSLRPVPVHQDPPP